MDLSLVEKRQRLPYFREKRYYENETQDVIIKVSLPYKHKTKARAKPQTKIGA